MMNKHLLLLVLALLASCATYKPKNPPSLKIVEEVSASYNATWAGVIDYFATMNLPIERIHKESGLISSQKMENPTQYVYGHSINLEGAIIDCNTVDFNYLYDPRSEDGSEEEKSKFKEIMSDGNRYPTGWGVSTTVSFNVTVREIKPSLTRVTVNVFTGSSYTADEPISCHSTGNLEYSLFEFLKDSLKKNIRR